MSTLYLRLKPCVRKCDLANNYDTLAREEYHYWRDTNNWTRDDVVAANLKTAVLGARKLWMQIP